MNLLTYPNIVYWLVLALTIYLMSRRIHEAWKRQENHRWTLGYATVFALALPGVYLGYLDFATYATLFVGVGVAGMIKVGKTQADRVARAQAIRERAGGQKYAPHKGGR